VITLVVVLIEVRNMAMLLLMHLIRRRHNECLRASILSVIIFLLVIEILSLLDLIRELDSVVLRLALILLSVKPIRYYFLLLSVVSLPRGALEHLGGIL
jgi:hypothetical protein